MMKQVAYGTDGSIDSLRIETAPVPKAAPGEILIEVHYAGVNGPDIAQRQGRYPPPPDASPVLGLEVAGYVSAVGAGVGQWHVGDAVTALVPGGGYAEFCVTPATLVLPVPEGMSLSDAAGLPEVWFTAWANLVGMADIQPGEHVLIHGGAGGVGMAAIQLARHFGAHVFATDGNADKLSFCLACGADTAINYQEQDFVEVIRAETGKRGIDIVLDSVGGSYVQKNLSTLTKGGRLLIIALNQGSKVEVDLMTVLSRRLTIAGSTMRSRSLVERAAIAAALHREIWPALAAGDIRPHTFKIVPLAEVAEAHRLMEGRAHVGKIVLQVAGSK